MFFVLRAINRGATTVKDYRRLATLGCFFLFFQFLFVYSLFFILVFFISCLFLFCFVCYYNNNNCRAGIQVKLVLTSLSLSSFWLAFLLLFFS